MSKESWEFDNNSSQEDIELTELGRRPDNYSDSGSSADFTTSCRWSTTQIESSEDEAFHSAVSFLNNSDENHLAFDICRTSSRSLEGTSSGTLTRKAASLEGLSIRRVSFHDHLAGPSTRRISSLNSLERPSSRRVLSLGGLTTRRFSSLERPSTRRIWVGNSPPDFLDGPSPVRVSFLNPLGGPSTRRVLSLERTSSRRVSFLHTLEGPLGRRVSSLEGPWTRRVASQHSHEGPSTMRVSSLDPMEGPSTSRVSSLKGSSTKRVAPLLDLLKGPSTGKVASLDPAEGSLTRRVTSMDPMEGPSMKRVASLDPLEGPSNRTDLFPDSAEGSLSSVFRSNLSETETNEYFHGEPPADQNGCLLKALAWLNSFLRRRSRQIRNSVYYPLLLGVLIAIPYSAGYMGCMYYYLCDGCPKLPHLMYLVGIFGALILFLQLTAVLSKRYFSPHLNGQEFNTLMVCLCFPFFMLLVIELSTVYMCEPVFIPPHKEFCAKVFYNYAYCVNIAVPIIILLLMIINIPGYYDPSEAE